MLLTVISSVSIGLSIVLMMLIPLDVLNVSTLSLGSDVYGRAVAIEVLYFVVFLSMIVLVFLVIPFAYFYFEEGPEASLGRRLWAGLKYTIASIVVFIVIVILGFVLRGTLDPVGLEPYGQQLLNELNTFEAAVHFMIACTAFIGLLIWLTYSAFGFSWIGFSWLKKRPTIEEQSDGNTSTSFFLSIYLSFFLSELTCLFFFLLQDLEREITIAREQRRHLRSKQVAGRINQKYRKQNAEEEVGLLTRKERVLRARQEQLGAVGKCYKRCVVITRPISIAIGILLMLWMLFILLSLLLSSIDKLSPSAHAYVLAHQKIFNPMDSLLSICVGLFPLDFFIFFLVVIFMWFATVSGITRLGIRFLWISIHQIKRQRTAPQGVLIFALMLVLASITITFMIDTLAPNYTTFGDQMFYLNNTGMVQCSISAPQTQDCSMTQIERIVNDVKFRFSFFSIVFYWSNWVFFAFFVGGVVLSICLKVKKNLIYMDNELDEEFD